MKKVHVKAIISILLILIFLFLAITGVLMYVVKTGMVLGIPRAALRETHFWMAISICLLTLIHIVLNFRIFIGELRSLLKRKR